MFLSAGAAVSAPPDVPPRVFLCGRPLVGRDHVPKKNNSTTNGSRFAAFSGARSLMNGLEMGSTARRALDTPRKTLKRRASFSWGPFQTSLLLFFFRVDSCTNPTSRGGPLSAEAPYAWQSFDQFPLDSPRCLGAIEERAFRMISLPDQVVCVSHT